MRLRDKAHIVRQGDHALRRLSASRRQARVPTSRLSTEGTTALAANAKSVEEYRAGKDKAFNALVGQAMKATKGKANPAQVNELLKKKLGSLS